MKTTLLGAAGAIGKSLADELRARGQEYRVVGRNAESLAKIFGSDPLAELRTWNPDDPASIREALCETDTLIYLVGVPYDQFHLHPILMERTLEAAIAMGVKNFVLVGTVYPYGRAQATPVTESHPREPHTYKGRMRKQQEDLLLAADAAGKIRGTVLRLPDFYGPEVDRSFLHGVFLAAAQGGKADMVGPIDLPHEFVYVPDAAPVILDLAAHPGAYGKWWHFAGAGATTQRKMMAAAFAVTGRKPSYRVAGKFALRLLGLFNPVMKEMVEMHYLVTQPLMMDDRALSELLGGLKKTPYAEGVRRCVEASRKA
jgi:nucleoside-diphosphate-sugar epimerase